MSRHSSRKNLSHRLRRAKRSVILLSSNSINPAEAEYEYPTQQSCPRSNWQPDSSSRWCKGCKRSFSFVVRRHHCRRCGHLFCARCCNERKVLGEESGYGSTPQRQCRSCSILNERLLELYIEEQRRRMLLVTEQYESFHFPVLFLLSCVTRKQPERRQRMKPASVDRIPLGDSFPVSDSMQSPAGTPSARTSSLTMDEPLVRGALHFLTVLNDVASHPACLRDRRVGLKLFKAVVSSEEVVWWFASRCSSVDSAKLFEVFTRSGLLEPTGDSKLWRVDETVAARYRDQVLPTPPAPGVGTPVLFSDYREAVVIAAPPGASMFSVMFPDGSVELAEASAVDPSPLAALAEVLPRLLSGSVPDVDGDRICLADAREDLLKLASSFLEDVQQELQYDHPVGNSLIHNVFTASEAVDWLMTKTDLNEVASSDFCQILRQMGLFHAIPRNHDAPFNATSPQYYRLFPQALRSLHDAISFVPKQFMPLPNNPSPGTPAFITVPSRHGFKEGIIEEVLGEDKHFKVQFSDGSAWVYGRSVLVLSPVVPALEAAHKTAVDLKDPKMRGLVALFSSHVSSFVKPVLRVGFSRFRNSFAADEAAMWLAATFPSLTTSDAYDVGDVLRRGGLFTIVSTGVKFAKRQICRFVERQSGANASKLLREVLYVGSVTRQPGKERRTGTPPESLPSSSLRDSFSSRTPASLSDMVEAARPADTPVRPGSKRGSLPAASRGPEPYAQGFVLVRLPDGESWAVRRLVVTPTPPQQLEFHAPRARMLSCTRLRSLPADSGVCVWQVPDAYAELAEVVFVEGLPEGDGGAYQLVRCRAGEGYTRCSSLQPVPALTAATPLTDITAHPSSLAPDLAGGDCSFVINDESGTSIYLCAPSVSERNKWLGLLGKTP